MRRKLSFRQKLFLNFTFIFAAFTVMVLLFQFERERNFSRSKFEVTLDNITRLSYNYYRYNDSYGSRDYWMIDSLTTLATDLDIRITIIDRSGKVVFDSEVGDVSGMENHLNRPEVKEALEKGTGSNIRESATTGRSYYYYTRTFPGVFVRAAAYYDVDVANRLHVEPIFIAFLVLLFIVFAIVLMFFTGRISETITKLKDFAVSLSTGKEPPSDLEFPEDDLGTISTQITSIYRDLTLAQKEIHDEREKLFIHLDALNEGIAFYTPEKKNSLANQHFIQNLNLIAGKSSVTADGLFGLPSMEGLVAFIERTLADPVSIRSEIRPVFETVLQRNKRYFTLRCMFFTDASFEVVIINTTRTEKRKQIMQQVTSNISHELKTPVTSILGYLETLYEVDVPEKIRKQFLKRALRQTERLSDLISDISSLSKITEAGDTYPMEKVRLRKIVDEVRQHLQMKLDDKGIKVKISLAKELEITGNQSLLFSVFYNLFDNVIKYGGENIAITLDNYLEDRKYYYFSFSNNGNTVDEVHLTRIFERFYRIDTARSREEGGTGLGLAIVKNAIELHGGTITAKSRPKGGLEFLFTLSK